MNSAGSLIFNGSIIPPVIEVRPQAHVLKAPDLPDAAKAGEIVDLQFEDVTGKTQATGRSPSATSWSRATLAP